MFDYDEINAILAEMRDNGMVEPIDEPDCNPFDFAEVTHLWDEMYPEPIDADDLVW